MIVALRPARDTRKNLASPGHKNSINPFILNKKLEFSRSNSCDFGCEIGPFYAEFGGFLPVRQRIPRSTHQYRFRSTIALRIVSGWGRIASSSIGW